MLSNYNSSTYNPIRTYPDHTIHHSTIDFNRLPSTSDLVSSRRAMSSFLTQDMRSFTGMRLPNFVKFNAFCPLSYTEFNNTHSLMTNVLALGFVASPKLIDISFEGNLTWNKHRATVAALVG